MRYHSKKIKGKPSHNCFNTCRKRMWQSLTPTHNKKLTGLEIWFKQHALSSTLRTTRKKILKKRGIKWAYDKITKIIYEQLIFDISGGKLYASPTRYGKKVNMLTFTTSIQHDVRSNSEGNQEWGEYENKEQSEKNKKKRIQIKKE